MLKLVVLTIAAISLLPSSKPKENEGIQDVKNLIPAWSESAFEYEYSFENSGFEFELFSVKDKNEIKGYAVFYETQIALIYQGSSIPAKNEMKTFELVSPVKEIASAETKKAKTNVTKASGFSSYSYICKPTQLSVSEVYSQSATFYLENVPEYYNDVVSGGCAPTVGVMLISFYDRYSAYTSLYNGLLPLAHDENKSKVDEFIKTMATYMHTTENGTSRTDEVIGIQNYLDQNHCLGFQVEVGYTFSDYIDYYTYSKNPIFVSIEGHAILGIGYASVRKYNSDGTQSLNQFMITHYDWRSRPGNYYVPKGELEQFLYIIK